jgi:hypothetical protein
LGRPSCVSEADIIARAHQAAVAGAVRANHLGERATLFLLRYRPIAEDLVLSISNKRLFFSNNAKKRFSARMTFAQAFWREKFRTHSD